MQLLTTVMLIYALRPNHVLLPLYPCTPPTTTIAHLAWDAAGMDLCGLLRPIQGLSMLAETSKWAMGARLTDRLSPLGSLC